MNAVYKGASDVSARFPWPMAPINIAAPLLHRIMLSYDMSVMVQQYVIPNISFRCS